MIGLSKHERRPRCRVCAEAEQRPSGSTGCPQTFTAAMSSAEAALRDAVTPHFRWSWTQGDSNPDLLAASQTGLNGVLCSGNAGHERAKRSMLCAETNALLRNREPKLRDLRYLLRALNSGKPLSRCPPGPPSCTPSILFEHPRNAARRIHGASLP